MYDQAAASSTSSAQNRQGDDGYSWEKEYQRSWESLPDNVAAQSSYIAALEFEKRAKRRLYVGAPSPARRRRVTRRSDVMRCVVHTVCFKNASKGRFGAV